MTLVLILYFNHAAASNTCGFCGKGVGSRCPDGQCCSGDEQCGFSNAHCGAGCQETFGSCNNDATGVLVEYR